LNRYLNFNQLNGTIPTELENLKLSAVKIFKYLFFIE